MAELTYLYNTFIIIAYVAVFTLAIAKSLKEDNSSKKNFHQILALYFIFFIIDNTIISMTELIFSFSKVYNQTFSGMPFIKTIVFTVNNFCQFWLIQYIGKTKLRSSHYVLVILISLWMALCSLFPNSAYAVFFYYFPNQLLLFYTGTLAFKNFNKNQTVFYLNQLGWICIVFAILISIEDFFVIFNIDNYHFLNIKIQNRNFSEDIFSLFISGEALHYYLIDKQYSLFSKYPIGSKELFESNDSLNLFFDNYQLTDREKEICELILKGKNNQEIAQELFLSVGTVKAHIHNIYSKMNIHTRKEFFDLKENFLKSYRK
ncbi:helix-turn-helix transcriptional regulator [Streptococcus marimammalium]|uniref:helix-turn-helix transcriptional regulator n=1 Tax=Streptococcus marimammalium TaxID=269666 RepID=UPI0003671DBC|nr:response regulator transcription factor [Streptococcus marimammalium]